MHLSIQVLSCRLGVIHITALSNTSSSEALSFGQRWSGCFPSTVCQVHGQGWPRFRDSVLLMQIQAFVLGWLSRVIVFGTNRRISQWKQDWDTVLKNDLPGKRLVRRARAHRRNEDGEDRKTTFAIKSGTIFDDRGSKGLGFTGPQPAAWQSAWL